MPIVFFSCKVQHTAYVSKLIQENRNRPIFGPDTPDYLIKNKMLIKTLSSLTFDSVKVFHFNMGKVDMERFTLKVNIPNLNKVIEGGCNNCSEVISSQTTDKGKLLQNNDGQQLLKILKVTYKDIFQDDEVSPYRPTVSFVFFKNGIVCAHVNVAYSYNKVELEVIEKSGKTFTYFWELIGTKTNMYLKQLCIKYHLPEWVLQD